MDNNQYSHLALEREDGENTDNLAFARRSSLKPRSSEAKFKQDESGKKSFKKKITWSSNDEPEVHCSSGMKSPERSYDDAKTHFVYQFVRKEIN
jgi:hypothetical protein